ncbi:hypothetical protein [Idiomarina abyssalis]|uniref:hypothetical protein n=1 Tax=Idiomarina abyssalis TaxID=86102 RepID=UPI003A8FB4E2
MPLSNSATSAAPIPRSTLPNTVATIKNTRPTKNKLTNNETDISITDPIAIPKTENISSAKNSSPTIDRTNNQPKLRFDMTMTSVTNDLKRFIDTVTTTMPTI